MKLAPFRGVVSNQNPHLLPPGAVQSQSNLMDNVPGEKRNRGGHRRPTIANDTTDVTSDVIAMTAFNQPGARWIVYQLADGKIKAARDLT